MMDGIVVAGVVGTFLLGLCLVIWAIGAHDHYKQR